jgi:hypothetical protein
MSFEEVMQEHIKALQENTKALKEYTKAMQTDTRRVEVEHTKFSACKFCGITYKTFDKYVAGGIITACKRKGGKREHYMEKDLVLLCEAKKLYNGEYGIMRDNPNSQYYGN